MVPQPSTKGWPVPGREDAPAKTTLARAQHPHVLHPLVHYRIWLVYFVSCKPGSGIPMGMVDHDCHAMKSVDIGWMYFNILPKGQIYWEIILRLVIRAKSRAMALMVLVSIHPKHWWKGGNIDMTNGRSAADWPDINDRLWFQQNYFMCFCLFNTSILIFLLGLMQMLPKISALICSREWSFRRCNVQQHMSSAESQLILAFFKEISDDCILIKNSAI